MRQPLVQQPRAFEPEQDLTVEQLLAPVAARPQLAVSAVTPFSTAEGSL
ncbi:MAG: hypothetical protein AAFO75_02980 [Pseudomonadota bacterium]